MNIRPKVAIAIVSYNHQEFIVSCLNSVLSQDYDNVAIFISDDCSTDNTPQVIRDFVELNSHRFSIKYDLKKQNIGVANNFNFAVEMALTDKEVEYIIPFAGDDLMMPDKISRQIEALEKNKNLNLCYSNMQWFDSKTNKKLMNHFNFLFRPSLSITKIISEALIPTPTLCIRRKAFDLVKYNTDLRYINDYLIAVEVSLMGGVVYVPEVLVKYRKHGSSIMDTTLFLEERVEAANIIIDKYGFEKDAKRFAKTAQFDYLLKALYEGNYTIVFVRFIKLLPCFLSSQKWLFRMLKFFSIVLKKVIVK